MFLSFGATLPSWAVPAVVIVIVACVIVDWCRDRER